MGLTFDPNSHTAFTFTPSQYTRTQTSTNNKICHSMHTRHKHTTYACQNTHTSHIRALTAPRLTIQTEGNTSPITSHTQTYNILQHSKAQTTHSPPPLSSTTAATQQIFPQTPTQSLEQTCAIYTHLLSLAI